MTSCSPLDVVLIVPDTPTLTPSDESTPVFVGNSGGVALSSGEVTCCAEGVVLTVGVRYDAQWLHDSTVNYGAQVN